MSRLSRGALEARARLEQIHFDGNQHRTRDAKGKPQPVLHVCAHGRQHRRGEQLGTGGPRTRLTARAGGGLLVDSSDDESCQ
jgi:hypothetical protein